MGYSLKQNQTARPLEFKMRSSIDHISGVTGLTPTVYVSKNGGAGTGPSGAVTEIDPVKHPGWYKVAPNATDTNTLGPLLLTATGTGADPTDEQFEVVSYNPDDGASLGLTAVPSVLTAAGLDNIPTTNTAGAPATFRLMMVKLYRRFFGKVKKDGTAKTITAYMADGTTADQTQNYTSAGGTDTVGEAV
jgi:hypothetical protein